MERDIPRGSPTADPLAPAPPTSHKAPQLKSRSGLSLRVDRPLSAPPANLPLLPAAILLGVLAGFLELGVFQLQRDLWPRLSRESLLWNRHVDWMIPLAGAGLAITVGLLLDGLTRHRSPRARGLALATALVLGPILAIRGLHPLAALVLALGLGVRSARPLAWSLSRLGRAARPLAVVALVALGAWVVGRYGALVDHDAAAGQPSSSPITPAPDRPRPPSLLWIVLDTVRADRLSLHGYHRPTTPNLQRWAARGITFDQARAAAPWTLPSHMTMLTGLWPFEHAARIDRPYQGPRPLVAEVLHDRDYATAAFLANFECVNACFGFDRGFDTFLDDAVRQEISPRTVLASASLGRLVLPIAAKLSPDLKWPPKPHVKRAPEVLNLARSWLDRHADDSRSQFLFLNLMDAHGPYRPPADWPRQFHTDPVPARIRDTTPQLGFEALHAARSASPQDRPAKLADIDAAATQLGDLYDDCLASLDHQLGAFLDDLAARGRLDDTWIIITSDHGEHFGEHGHFGHGSSLYDPALHVPLLLVPPLNHPYDDARGRRVADVVSLRDLPATVSDLLLSAGSGPFPGRSLSRFWRKNDDPTAPDHDAPIAQLAQQNIDAGHAVDGAAVRDIDALFARGRTLIRNRPAAGPLDELYDTTADPHQLQNLADDPGEAERKRQLGDLLERRLLSPRE